MTAVAAMPRVAPSSKKSFTENLCHFVLWRREVQPCLPDGTSVGPCDLCRDPWPDEALTSEHCKGRDDNAVQQRYSKGGYRWLFMDDISEAAPCWRWRSYWRRRRRTPRTRPRSMPRRPGTTGRPITAPTSPTIT